MNCNLGEFIIVMHRKIFSIVALLLTALLIFPLNPGFADEKIRAEEFREEWTLERYVKYFYNRYSAHFDEIGLKYMAPDYGVDYFKSAETPREIMSLAMYYKYRAEEGDSKAEKILYSAILEARKKLMERPMSTLSFEDAEAIFLMLCFFEEKKLEIGNWKLGNGLNTPPSASSGQALTHLKGGTKEDVADGRGVLHTPLSEDFFKWVAKYIEAGIKAPDTENRAIISAAHWQYIVDYLNAKGYISNIEKKRYGLMIKDKVDFAIKTNIKKGAWYVEGKDDDFTPHYHAVCAYMLMAYYKLTGYSEYKDISFAMYENLKKISFDNGMVEARIGHRPCGLGAQFYFMVGMLGRAFEDSDYTAYLFYGFGSRFFSDQDYPNRLEYHSTIEGTESNFHDDYSFIDVAEIALAIPSLKKDEEKFRFTYMLSTHYIGTAAAGFFVQKNDGREIIFNGKKFILGSFGNWARQITGNNL